MFRGEGNGLVVRLGLGMSVAQDFSVQRMGKTICPDHLFSQASDSECGLCARIERKKYSPQSSDSIYEGHKSMF